MSVEQIIGAGPAIDEFPLLCCPPGGACSAAGLWQEVLLVIPEIEEPWRLLLVNLS